ncbi:uncharacterized protein EI97DRAFT_462531 [Westerdykella ornata]|uniref:AttH domain-containing protein n=1 Tax=Westerdykella ornata TaxID=318751 RepID=A0A6A6J5R1_WESOR|nr:uncharacterized protein EI97DRAFT_462531 [Westerdykella ornata]KAF2271732.1 hypothetical protein EI97DRAFT_462531 [Westerdykella ornata]
MKLSSFLVGAAALAACTTFAQDPIPLVSDAQLAIGDVDATVAQDKYIHYAYLNEMFSGLSTAQFNLTSENVAQSMEAPRVWPRPNITSFDSWYFDAVNPLNLNESIVVILYLATNASFPLRSTSFNSVSADIFLNFADGSSAPIQINSTLSLHQKDWAAIVSTANGSAGASGNWPKAGVSFQGWTDGSRVLVRLNAPEHGIAGTLDIRAVAPAHYPCSMKGQDGETLEAAHRIGWTNLIPDGQATVNLTAGARQLQFTNGVGYHDQKWSDRPFQEGVKDWYWGHARLGAYSIVWLHSANHDGKTYSNAYIYHIGSKASRVTCGNKEKSQPNPTFIALENFKDYTDIRFAFPESLPFKMRVEKTKILDAYGPFSRWSGKVSTDLVGGTRLEGSALFEEIHF